jgi:hypothetical protein
MKFYSAFKNPQGWQFMIAKDYAGYCLYVYEHEEFFQEDLSSDVEGCPHHQQDYLQDDVEMAKEFAFEDFGVPLDSWQEAPDPKPNHHIERK